MADDFAGWIDAAPDWERLAPVPFSTICFRHIPPGLSGSSSADAAAIDDHNSALMDTVNRTGEVFLSHTRLRGRFAIRLAIGNVRTQESHVVRAWQLLREAAR